MSFGAYSQNKKVNPQSQTIDPTVEVNRDFEGKIMEVHKGKLKSVLADSLYNFNVKFNYSFFEKPYKDMYEFAPVASAKVPQLENNNRPEIIAKAGMGYPLAPQAEVLYTPELDNGNYLNLGGNFNLYKGKVPSIQQVEGIPDNTYLKRSGEKVENNERQYGIWGKYTRAWKSGEFNLNAGFDGGYNTYFGKAVLPPTGSGEEQAYHSDKDMDGHNYIRANVGLGIKSSGAGKYGKKFNYAANLALQHTGDKWEARLKENLVKFHGEMGPTVGRYNKFMVGVDAQAVMYAGTANYYYVIFGLTPQYRYENGRFKVNLGVKAEGKFTNSNRENIDRFHHSIFPAADLSFGIIPQKIWLYAKADGWNTLNEYSSLLETNKFINPETTIAGLMPSSVPLNIEIGFKGRLTDKFSYSLYGGWSVHKGLQQFLYDMDLAWFNTIYSNNFEYYTGAVANVKTERFEGGIKFRYSAFSESKAGATIENLENSENCRMKVLGYPMPQGDIFAKYNWNKKLYIMAGCHLQGEYYCSIDTKVPGFADLGAGVGYMYSPMLSFWLKGENLLNSATQYLPYYTRRSAGFVAGIIVKL